MKFFAFKNFKLLPIGSVVFILDNKSRRKGQRVLLKDVIVHHDTTLTISEAISIKLDKLMCEKGSDLLTDGTYFYATFGNVIRRIEHPSFHSILNMEENFEKNYKKA